MEFFFSESLLDKISFTHPGGGGLLKYDFGRGVPLGLEK